MANLHKTRTLFAFTSPRSVEKIIPEIRLLVEGFNGMTWNASSQRDFFKTLFHSGLYEGKTMPENITLAARDRITRAPKALGFVDLKPTITLTEAGQQLLSGKQTHEIIAKQLLKFQLPSPYHPTPSDRNFNVKPYLELLRLIQEIGSVSKTEIAIFFVQMTHHNKFDDIVQHIQQFRYEASLLKGNRKAFVDKVFTEQILIVYKDDDVQTSNFKTRESQDSSLEKFIRTKKSNHFDYADAFLRYLRATQYISFDRQTFRAIVSPTRAKEVEFILKTVDREATLYNTEAEYKHYLCNATSLQLLTDTRDFLIERLHTISADVDVSADISVLKDTLEAQEAKLLEQVKRTTQATLKHYQEFDDILGVFQKIKSKEVPDPPLYLEWNVWRSMVMLNYAKTVQGNFTIDLDGIPLHTASGNKPDIEAEYHNFNIIVEVTTSTGNRQYEMEGEPVARHFGFAQRASDVPVYCLFIAPKISEGALAHFFNLNRMNTKAYGGKTRIIPMSIEEFILFITTAKNKSFRHAPTLKSYLDNLLHHNLFAEDEELWYRHIQTSLPAWV